MVAFNRVLSALELAASLGRQRGRAEFRRHEVTHGLHHRTSFQDDELQLGPGAQVWAWQTAPLVTVLGSVAAAAQETESSRLVIMDAGLLLPWGESNPRLFVTMTENAIEWLAGK